MALKATIYKASIQIADMDRGIYLNPILTIAQHPSETEERLMVRLLAYCLNVPADDHHGALVMARGLSDTDEPDVWQHDLTGQLMHWIEVGQTDERRMSKACGRADRVTMYAYAASVPVWWAPIAPKVARLTNLEVWRIDSAQSQALAALAERSMQLQLSVQDGTIWIGNATTTVEIQPAALKRRG
jgi:uncharacterized protein YaeQ